MFFRYALQQMPTLFAFVKKTAEGKEPHSEKRGAQLISQIKIHSGKEVGKRTLPRRRLIRAVEAKTKRWGNRPPHPHSTGDTPHHSRVREHQKPRYTPTVSRASSASKNAALVAFVPSAPCVPAYREHRRCTASVLSPVSPLFYDHRFQRPQRHRAKPIPLRRGRNFFRLRKKYHDGASAVILRCRKATYHISLARYITLIRKDLKLFE